jgi:beta-galactosidase
VQGMFKKTTIAVTVTLTLSVALIARGGGGSSGSDAPLPPSVNLSELRSVTPLMQKWLFVQDDALSDAQALANDGSNWSTVTLPHTWNSKDAATTAQSTRSTPTYKRGLGWYRLAFDYSGKAATQWLQFDAASIAADVWLNGEKLGQHQGAFTAFRFNVTGKLKATNNVLVVKTDNRSARAATDPTAVEPLGGDFNVSGGLYRGVSLISTPSAAHFALDDFGSTGIFARTTSLSGVNANVNVLAKLKNDSKTDGRFTVQATLLEADGTTIKQAVRSTAVTVKAGAAASVAQDLAVSHAHLWNGLADPYLYRLVVELKDSNGASVDKVVQNFGIRQMTFDPNKGFSLNGKSMPLHGVNQHQDMLGKAWAITPADTDLSFSFIKEIGANTVRLAHYPHADYTYEQADKLGLVVWAENPLVNSTTVGSGVDPEITGFAANARQQLTELIRQRYNHASIGIWSIANEVTGGTDASNTVQALLKSLNATAKAEDPGRITTLANQVTRSGDIVQPDRLTQTGYTDSYSVNRYFQWYYGTSETQLGDNLDDLHAKNPTQPIGVSEYGAGSAITHHTDNVHGGRVCGRDGSGSTRICYQPEEYANYVHETAYATMVARPYIMGTWVWNMFDFGSGNRHEGDIGQTNTKGLVTFGRDVKKDSFFFYKANWSQTPVTYISGRRYTQRAYRVVSSLKVYSNADSVTLKVNDQTVGTKLAASCPLNVCEFTKVALQAGNNVITAVGTYRTTSVTDEVTWNVSTENATNTCIAAGQLTTGFKSTDSLLGNHTYGSDDFFVGGELPVAAGFGAIGLSGATVINGLDTTTIPETGRVWDMWREGSAFSYQIPMANGTYKVTLGFLEPSATTAGQRVFNVDANGVRQITSLDVFAAAGAKNTAIARSFTVTVSDGMLTLGFTGVTGKAILSNISAIKQ